MMNMVGDDVKKYTIKWGLNCDFCGKRFNAKTQRKQRKTRSKTKTKDKGFLCALFLTLRLCVKGRCP